MHWVVIALAYEHTNDIFSLSDKVLNKVLVSMPHLNSNNFFLLHFFAQCFLTTWYGRNLGPCVMASWRLGR